MRSTVPLALGLALSLVLRVVFPAALPVALPVVGLVACAAGPSLEEHGKSDSAVWRFLEERYDRNRDGQVTRAEYRRSERGFRNLDVSEDGVVSALDFDPSFDGVLRGPWESFEEFEYGEGGPEVGDLAPPIRLTSTTGQDVELEDFLGQRPVALVFGSFT